jgi:hypothetical protein
MENSILSLTDIYVNETIGSKMRGDSYSGLTTRAVVINIHNSDLNTANLFYREYSKIFKSKVHLYGTADLVVYIDIPIYINHFSHTYVEFLESIIEIYNNIISGNCELNPEFVICNSCAKKNIIRIEDKYNGLDSWMRDEDTNYWYCCSDCWDNK